MISREVQSVIFGYLVAAACTLAVVGIALGFASLAGWL